MSNQDWTPAEPAVDHILSTDPDPLASLARGDIPAIVIRQAYKPADGLALIDRFVGRELMDDPRSENAGGQRGRIDIGTSLGYRGEDREAFFDHSRQTRELFSRLFDKDCDPVSLIYGSLQELSVDKKVQTARESDGSLYGPAILRAHYGGYAYAPHFDSVRLREKRASYAVHSFEHQFAGVLVLQNTSAGDRTAQGIIHRCPWEPEVDPYLEAGTFQDYAAEKGIEQVEVVLEPGDLYFFNTRMIHEVPGLAGLDPRIVLATFIGYSAGREEIFVWS